MTIHNLSPSEATSDRYARRIAARLSAGEPSIGHDITERLRVARQQAVAARRIDPLIQVQLAVAEAPRLASATAGAGGEAPGWWTRIASVIPLLMLVGGLVVIDMVRSDQRARELADVDTQLLSDDLPPSAYTDPGFAQFLRTGGGNAAAR
ncbi:MAG: DUF3619 family protein [Burkholderiales bacterium]|jgi:hypothetical protein|nr:DUF3619 family protein [Burkholderiales bacterium]